MRWAGRAPVITIGTYFPPLGHKAKTKNSVEQILFFEMILLSIFDFI